MHVKIRHFQPKTFLRSGYHPEIACFSVTNRSETIVSVRLGPGQDNARTGQNPLAVVQARAFAREKVTEQSHLWRNFRVLQCFTPECSQTGSPVVKSTVFACWTA